MAKIEINVSDVVSGKDFQELKEGLEALVAEYERLVFQNRWNIACENVFREFKEENDKRKTTEVHNDERERSDQP